MDAVDRGLTRIARWCHLATALLVLPLLVALVGLDVAMRYIFASPLIWGQEVTSLLLFLFFVLSLGYGWSRRVHVQMEMVYDNLPPRPRAASDMVTGICGLIVFGMIATQAYLDIPYMRMISESSEELEILLWPFRLLLAVASSLLCVQLLVSTLKALRALVAGGRRWT